MAATFDRMCACSRDSARRCGQLARTFRNALGSSSRVERLTSPVTPLALGCSRLRCESASISDDARPLTCRNRRLACRVSPHATRSRDLTLRSDPSKVASRPLTSGERRLTSQVLDSMNGARTSLGGVRNSPSAAHDLVRARRAVLSAGFARSMARTTRWLLPRTWSTPRATRSGMTCTARGRRALRREVTSASSARTMTSSREVAARWLLHAAADRVRATPES